MTEQVATELAVYDFLYSFVVWEDETQIVDGCLRGQRRQNVNPQLHEHFNTARANLRKFVCIATVGYSGKLDSSRFSSKKQTRSLQAASEYACRHLHLKQCP